jgi:putative membrane protein
MVKNIFLALIVMFPLSIQFYGSPAAMAVFAAAAVFVFAFLVLFWARTTITFGQNEIIVESNVLYKKRKTIPHRKIASVNVVRDIFNRIFGTTTIRININSSKNASIPEANFVLDAALAEQIRNSLASNLFSEPAGKESEIRESLADLSMKDIVLHGLIGTSTYQLIYAAALLVFSAFSAIFMNGSATMVSLFLFFTGEAVPVFFVILKYGNFKVCRINSHIYLQHGIVRSYVSEFDVNRINAIRIKRTFFGRILGKSSLEAEVIGINAVSGDINPTLCILTDDSKIEYLIKQLVPEFVHEPEMAKQPRRARLPLLAKTSAGTALVLLLAAYPAYWIYLNGDTLFGDFTPTGVLLLKCAPAAAAVLSILLMFLGAHTSMKVREIGFGKDMFNIVNGILDRQTLIIQYDRVQITAVSAGLMARRLGLAKCTISLMSSAGYKNIRSGYFDRDELSRIGEMMLLRLKDGTYRYDRNSI